MRGRGSGIVAGDDRVLAGCGSRQSSLPIMSCDSIPTQSMPREPDCRLPRNGGFPSERAVVVVAGPVVQAYIVWARSQMGVLSGRIGRARLTMKDVVPDDDFRAEERAILSLWVFALEDQERHGSGGAVQDPCEPPRRGAVDGVEHDNAVPARFHEFGRAHASRRGRRNGEEQNGEHQGNDPETIQLFSSPDALHLLRVDKACRNYKIDNTMGSRLPGTHGSGVRGKEPQRIRTAPRTSCLQFTVGFLPDDILFNVQLRSHPGVIRGQTKT